MSFHIWFKLWLRCIRRMLLFASPKKLTERERQRAKAKRLERKRRGADRLGKKREKPLHPNARLAGGVMDLFVITVALILFLPGLFHWGYNSRRSKARKAERAYAASALERRTESFRSISRQPSEKTDTAYTSKAPDPPKSTAQTKTECAAKSEKPAYAPKAHTHKSTALPVAAETKDTERCAPAASKQQLSSDSIAKAKERLCYKPEASSADEFIPKSAPISDQDSYIRKRMRVFLPIDKSKNYPIKVGDVIRLSALPDTDAIKNPVSVSYCGEHIGYADMSDSISLWISLDLGRKIYGVITEVLPSDNGTVFEYEAWFEK